MSARASAARRLFLPLGLAFLAAIGVVPGAPNEPVLRGIAEGRDADRFRFEVVTGAVEVSGEARAAEVRLPGFERATLVEGVPELPRKTVLVALPPGTTPLLEVLPLQETLLPEIVPRPTQTRVVEQFTESSEAAVPKGFPFAPEEREAGQLSIRQERVPDPALYSGSELYPAQIAWLGRTGTLRDQRYVEVNLAPVRYDPKLRALHATSRFEVTVRFEGDRGLRSPVRPEGVFEDVYRKAFLNYAQGTVFRVSATSVPELAPRPQAAKALSTAPLYRIRIRQNGIVRLDFSQLSSTPFASADLAALKLTSRGVEVPIQIQDDGDGVLEPGEWVQFYGQAQDDEPKAVLNTDIMGTEDLYEARDFSDENVYFLSVEPGARERVPAADATPTQTRVPPTDFEAVVHLETDNSYKPLGEADPWYWSPTLCIGSCSGAPPSSRTDSAALPGLASGSAPLRVMVHMRGVNEDTAIYPDHKLRVTLLDSSSLTLGAFDDNGTFDARTLYTQDSTWTYGGVGPQVTNPLYVKTEVLPSGAATNQAILDWIELHYRRTFSALADTLVFDWPNADAEFIVDGLADPTPSVYEVTAHVGSSGIASPARLTGFAVSGGGPYSVRFRVDATGSLPAQAPRRFVVTGSGALFAPSGADFTPDSVSDLRNTSNQADLIVIANPLVLDPSGPLTQLLTFRASQGLTSKTVLIEDVQDEFNDGLAGPLAIKKFLSFVLSTAPGEGWASPKPTYVLLLGDASYDYKGGTAAGNYVPTQILFRNEPQLGYYASDNVLMDVVGEDQLADLMVGRISARTQAEANTVLQKILDYETNPPPGHWRQHALFISDRGKRYNNEEALDFESVNTESESYMKRPPFTSRKLRYWSDFCSGGGCPYPATADAMRSAIKSAVNGSDGYSDGAVLAQYVGHGNFEWWSDDAFFDDLVVPADTSGLVNGGRLPWLLVHTCLTGGFHTTMDLTLGEDWLKRPGGGAVGVLAPSGLDITTVGHEVAHVIWNDLFGRYKRTDVATPVLDALVQLCVNEGAIDACQNYTYLGDPALKLVLPSVAPAGVPLATPGNVRVDLSWPASATPGVTYDVYRATNLVPENYQKLNPSGLTQTSYVDLAVQNTTTYYYVVVAVDAQGFESRWSNFNSDCPVNGPDCVKARPMNPNPPAPPSGIVVIDTEHGGGLRVTWNANSEPDIKGYTVWIGISPGNYTVPFNVANTTSAGLSGLTNGVTYYVVVTATNTSLLTSAPSLEMTGVPTSVQGVKAPGFVRTLHVSKSGTNAVLSWDVVTLDIYGKPETVASYEVYRGTTPTFVPSAGNRIGTTALPTFTDSGALLLSGSAYYLVRALDAEGNPGGLGNQLPDGISSLRINRAASPAGDLVLSWPAVTRDFDGQPIHVDHYNVYVAGQPFTRAQIRDGFLPVSATTSATSIQVTPAVTKLYYSVLAVDARGNLSPY